MTREAFEQLTEEAIAAIPEKFREKLNNVAIIIEPVPTQEQLKQSHVPPGASLFGLYEGIPQTKRWNYGQVLPDKITIFQQPIEWFAKTEDDIRLLITDTVWHEIAHHFGMDEHEVRRAEKRRRPSTT